LIDAEPLIQQNHLHLLLASLRIHQPVEQKDNKVDVEVPRGILQQEAYDLNEYPPVVFLALLKTLFNDSLYQGGINEDLIVD
jgi:hypothetical protein